MSERKAPSKIMGPVDYVVVMFPGNKFSGKIAPELERLQKNGIIRIIDLVFILKDAKGRTVITEAKNLTGEAGDAFRVFSAHLGEWLSEGDIDIVAKSLPLNSSAAALLFENTWALKFKEACMDADAQLISQGRIPGDLVMKVIEEKDFGGA
jgi:hypothetical protein